LGINYHKVANLAESSISKITQIRVLVGYLGEKEQHGWWTSSFFSSASEAFLSPIFPRTKFLARCVGVKSSATLIHDERIGVGRVHHLFRLPEHIEQRLHDAYLNEEIVSELKKFTEKPDLALDALLEMGGDSKDAGEGPVLISDAQELASDSRWADVALHYHRAFSGGYQTFPYFTEGS
jgi:hypothetical protein